MVGLTVPIFSMKKDNALSGGMVLARKRDTLANNTFCAFSLRLIGSTGSTTIFGQKTQGYYDFVYFPRDGQ